MANNGMATVGLLIQDGMVTLVCVTKDVVTADTKDGTFTAEVLLEWSLLEYWYV